MKRTLIIPFLLIAICVFAEDVTPYFTTPEMPNALRYLPAPPKTNEMRYAYDTAQYQWGKSVRNTPAWAESTPRRSLQRPADGGDLLSDHGSRNLEDKHSPTVETADGRNKDNQFRMRQREDHLHA